MGLSPRPAYDILIPLVCSNGLGLSSIKLAVKSIGGSVWLEANQHHTMLHAVLPATRCTAGTSAPTSDTRDDSPEVQPHLTTLRESGVPVATPALRQIVVHPSVEENRAAVKMEHEPHPNAPSTVPPPVCIGIDDSAMLRRVQVRAAAKSLRGLAGNFVNFTPEAQRSSYNAFPLRPSPVRRHYSASFSRQTPSVVQA
eukprot:scaffold47658_cov32-Tisochrysis_lutea.AAC.1